MRVHTIDLRFTGLDHAVAAFAVEGPSGWALVETGPGTTLPALIDGLSALGVHPGELAGALVTHIHLDHAGAAGWLARQGVPIYVHPVGAPHLVDPTRLLASATRIWGDRTEALWGRTLSAPADRVVAVDDGQIVRVAGLDFRAIATPGHAKHHHAWRVGDALFAGDAAGVRLPGSRLVAVPAVPPEFDPDAWGATIDRLEAEAGRSGGVVDGDVARRGAAGATAGAAGPGDAAAASPEAPATFHLTHWGAIDDAVWHMSRLRTELAAVVAFIAELYDAGAARDVVLERYVAWCRARALDAGVDEDELARFEAANPVEVSVDGVLRWLVRRSETA